MMNRFKRNLVMLSLFLFGLSSFYSCAHKEPIGGGNTKVEPWELQLTGETVGTLKMLLERTEVKKGGYAITGKISGAIRDHIGGQGEAGYKLKGKIDNNVLVATLNGHSEMSTGFIFTSGSMRGTVSKSQGSGTWSIRHAGGWSAGEYTMKKIAPPQ
jgi:hypothetical protein